jgi:L-arabonate dehydrase
MDVEARKLYLDVSDEELKIRRAAWRKPEQLLKGGFQQMHIEHVMQADKGADFDFLIGCRGTGVPRESH